MNDPCPHVASKDMDARERRADSGEDVFRRQVRVLKALANSAAEDRRPPVAAAAERRSA
jgi:hypothetical protein